MKENYQIYLPYQFHRRPHSVDWDAKLSHKKMKTMFLSNMSKSRRLTSTFFPISLWENMVYNRNYQIDWIMNNSGEIFDQFLLELNEKQGFVFHMWAVKNSKLYKFESLSTPPCLWFYPRDPSRRIINLILFPRQH